jgi:Flp pilus assembly protein TadG
MRRFWSDRKGNVAVLFAIAIVPIIGGIGAAVDYSMASAYRTDLQKALDATALALSKVLPIDDAAKRQEVGMQYFLASLGPNDLKNVALEIIPDSGKVLLRATGDYPLRIANVFGATDFQIGATAEAVWGMGKVEVVLALDNTGSMSGDKITQLKLGAQKLVDILKSSAREEGDAKIGIVPYTVQVRVDHNAVNLESSPGVVWHKLGGCSKSQYKGKPECEDEDGTWRESTVANWNGCLADRDRKDDDNDNVDYDVKATFPDPMNDDARFPRVQNSSRCPVATILPLTDVHTQAGYDAITAKISAMQAAGNTNVTIGAMWGWHLLDDLPPYTEAKPYQTKNLQKFLILMTDGDNTENRFSTSESSINGRTEKVCANIKALPQNTAHNPATPAIKVWSIRVISGNADLLKGCATDSTTYVSVTNANQLEGVFTKIGTEIASLHLAK